MPGQNQNKTNKKTKKKQSFLHYFLFKLGERRHACFYEVWDFSVKWGKWVKKEKDRVIIIWNHVLPKGKWDRKLRRMEMLHSCHNISQKQIIYKLMSLSSYTFCKPQWIILLEYYVYLVVLWFSILETHIEGIETFGIYLRHYSYFLWKEWYPPAYCINSSRVHQWNETIFHSQKKYIYIYSLFPTVIFIFFVMFYRVQLFLHIFEYLCLLVPYSISYYLSVPIYNKVTIEECRMQVICIEQSFPLHAVFSRFSLFDAFHLPFNFVQNILMSKNNVFWGVRLSKLWEFQSSKGINRQQFDYVA